MRQNKKNNLIIMIKQFLSLALFMSLSAGTMFAQKEGGLSTDFVKALHQKEMKSGCKALRNAAASNSIDALAKNNANKGGLDSYFSIETSKQSITDQKQSGRCWMFSGFNVLRSNFANRTDSLTVDLSQGYLFVYDQLEKSNLCLQGIIDNANKPMEDELVQFFFQHPINDGGTFCGVSDLVDKYGLVPHDVMPETVSSNDTKRISALVSSKLREYGLQLRQMVADKKSKKEIKAAKEEMIGTIYHMLTLAFGEPVQEFDYAFKNKDGKAVTPVKRYTPLTFAEEVVGHKLNGTFIMVMNDPRREYYKTYEVEYDRHVYDGHNWKYLNLPMEEIADMAIASLKGNTKMYSSYDVGKFLDGKRGYSSLDNFDYGTLFNTEFGMDKAQRIMTYDSGSTHAMTLVAVDLDANGKPTKWKVENSWTGSWGHNGYLIMTNEWFNEYMFRLVINKKYVPAKIQKMYEQKPTMLMPDDPLFLPDAE